MTVWVTSRNARFQQWEALLRNRTKRQRAGSFLVQGVRPVTMAVRSGWPIHELLYDADARLSAWARETLHSVTTTRVAVADELMRELGEKEEAAPELLAVVGTPPDDLGRIPTGDGLLAVVVDRPGSPGNLGTLLRSADAFGVSGVIVAGHAVDVYDPRTVRSSTGSIFAVPVVRVGSPREVLDWVSTIHKGVSLVGADETGAVDLPDADLRRAVVLAVGNETTGLSTAWRDACDELVRIPMAGSASSLNAAIAGSIVLYEAARQRGTGRTTHPTPADGR